MNNWKISLQFDTLTTALPQSYSEFIHNIKQSFQVSDFIVKHKGQIITEEYYYTLQDSTERKIEIQRVNKYYDTFISGKRIPCCNDVNCPLCQGSNIAQLRIDDENIIDILIRNKLQQKLQIIQRKLNLKSVSQFLEFCQPQYSVQWINQQNEVSVGEPKQIVSFKIGYKNNGNIDWPTPVFFQCVDDERFSKIKYQIDSLKLGDQGETVVSFPIPNLEPGKYTTFWRLGHLNQFGPKIQFQFTCLGIKHESIDYDKKNRQTLNEFKQQNRDLLSHLKLINLSMEEEMLKRHRTKLVTYDEIFNSLWK